MSNTSEGRLTIGLGEWGEAVTVTVRWPGGRRESWQSLSVDEVHRLIEGEGGDLVQ
jgi:hypothetical protein